MQLSKADVRRALIRYQFAQCGTVAEVFDRLRSVQFDPIAPVGCNHDLVLQARIPGYKIGDWQKLAYEERGIFDGWDKQASLVPFDRWPTGRYYYKIHRGSFDKIFDDHPEAVSAILKEIELNGPMVPKDSAIKDKKEEWIGSWLGSSLSKQTLRALWHNGLVMTTTRRSGQHVYDLTERVVPPELYNRPPISDEDSIRELLLERHRAVGILRPNASAELWSYGVLRDHRKATFPDLIQRGDLIPVEVEGVKANATPEFFRLLDLPSIEPRVTFIAPLDQLMWDRNFVAHLFNFDYSWEIYTPLIKRRWGYYVLPILYGDDLVARIEFYCRGEVLEVRQWHVETQPLDNDFFDAFLVAFKQFMSYASAKRVEVSPHVDSKIRNLVSKIKVR